MSVKDWNIPQPVTGNRDVDETFRKIIYAGKQTATGGSGSGDDGGNAYTTTTADFVVPAIGATVQVSVRDTSWMFDGQPIEVESAGGYEVDTIDSATRVTLENLGYAENAASSATILAGVGVSPGGRRGTDGSDGDDGTNGVGLELTPVGGTTITRATAAGTTTDTLLVLPGSGAGAVWISRVGLRLETALVGSGNATVTLGTSSGGTEIMLAQVITSSTAVGEPYGLAYAHWGTAFTSQSTNHYVAILSGASTLYYRIVHAGTITTSPILRVRVFGAKMSA